MIQSLGDNWAEQLIASEKMMAWLNCRWAISSSSSARCFRPLPGFRNVENLSAGFWFALGIALVLLLAWLR
jgi:hypothetical protein